MKTVLRFYRLPYANTAFWNQCEACECEGKAFAPEGSLFNRNRCGHTVMTKEERDNFKRVELTDNLYGAIMAGLRGLNDAIKLRAQVLQQEKEKREIERRFALKFPFFPIVYQYNCGCEGGNAWVSCPECIHVDVARGDDHTVCCAHIGGGVKEIYIVPVMPELTDMEKLMIEGGLNPYRALRSRERSLSNGDFSYLLRKAFAYNDEILLRRETKRREMQERLYASFMPPSVPYQRCVIGFATGGGKTESYLDWVRREYAELVSKRLREQMIFDNARLAEIFFHTKPEPIVVSCDTYDYFSKVFENGKLKNEVAELTLKNEALNKMTSAGFGNMVAYDKCQGVSLKTELLTTDNLQRLHKQITRTLQHRPMNDVVKSVSVNDQNKCRAAFSDNVMQFPKSTKQRKDTATVVGKILERSQGLRKSVYILGAQCTGKSTLANEIARTHVRNTGGTVRHVNMSQQDHNEYFTAGEEADVLIIDAADMKKILPLVNQWSTMIGAPKYIVVSQDVNAVVAFQPESRRSLAVLLQ